MVIHERQHCSHTYEYKLNEKHSLLSENDLPTDRPSLAIELTSKPSLNIGVFIPGQISSPCRHVLAFPNYGQFQTTWSADKRWRLASSSCLEVNTSYAYKPGRRRKKISPFCLFIAGSCENVSPQERAHLCIDEECVTGKRIGVENLSQ
jgi:hypothetical protein